MIEFAFQVCRSVFCGHNLFIQFSHPVVLIHHTLDSIAILFELQIQLNSFGLVSGLRTLVAKFIAVGRMQLNITFTGVQLIENLGGTVIDDGQGGQFRLVIPNLFPRLVTAGDEA